MSVHVGLDIGGTKSQAVVTSADGDVLSSHKVPSGRGPEAFVDSATQAVEGACAAAGIALADAASVGVGMPGTVADGVVRHAVNLGIERLDVAGVLSQAWGTRPLVDNDVNAAALGAWTLAGSGLGSMAYLNLGTGLAAGLVLGGRLWRGARGAAGEIGHVSVDPDGPTGPDGLPGGLEAYAGGSGISLASGDGRSASAILGSPDSDGERARLFFGVASAIRVLVLTVDVEKVLLGGGISGLAGLADGVTDVLDGWASRSAFLDSLELSSRFAILPGDEPVAAIGAAMLGAGRG